MEDDDAAEGMADESNWEIVDDVEERGQIQNVLGDTVHRAGCPGAVAVATQIERVDMIVLAEDACDPVPIARVVERTVHQNQRGLVVLAIVPKLEFQAIGIEEVGDGFHGCARESDAATWKESTWVSAKWPGGERHAEGSRGSWAT